MTTTKTAVKSESAVNSSLLAVYGKAVEGVHEIKLLTIFQTQEIEIAYMRASVASGLNHLDQKATLKTGQDKAKADGYKVLPDLGVGKVQVWSKALALLDGLTENDSVDLPQLLNLAWNTSRLPEGFILEGKTIEEIESAIPPRADTGKGEKAKAPRKTTHATPTLTQLAQIVEQVVEALPDDLSTLSDLDIAALAAIGTRLAGVSKGIKALKKAA